MTETPWTLWTVLQRTDAPTTTSHPSLAEAVAGLGDATAGEVRLRGLYDVSAMRADADLMIWLNGSTPDGLQAAQRTLRRTAELAPTTARWAVMGVHRPAEFSANHMPAFMRDVEPRTWLTVYPFVRSYDWYVLPEEERRAMLAEHGGKGRAYPQVLSNTVAAFALGDYEWILALEADELTDLVDLMRHLRATEARRHVREEVPFFTGRRIEVGEVPEVLR
ncbi:chlorite dismutase family protein [Actinotalea sp. M2MS4P-6]|uniref:hydrogen peroxide-dependent heme synthase n=1 Tax=Actinotalea sp. M2MS4P-6 TaxID=2983762 RepID=UPI0021E41EBE|nr:hydrogen peroxide-dependent heme synthase [Actinotalea sp. M2MS4P-6]MCV2392905.1 chlorite dismutase family protein [Actinotalea sp. M2MS4P-6]